MIRPKVSLLSRCRACVLVGGVLAIAAVASAGTDALGFFDEYLVLGPYANSGGAAPTAEYIASDFLCDSDVSEANFLPDEGVELGIPDAPGGCATEDTSYTGGDPVNPTVRKLPVGGAFGDIVDFQANLIPNDNMMAYAWVYVDNVTNPPRVLDFVLGLASDDSVEVKLNRSAIFSRSVGRWYDPAGTIQDRVPISLLPGGNLLQFKVFEGGGDWGLRARFESTSDCRPVLSGDGEIIVTASSIPLTPPPGTANRTIVTSGTTTADITVAATAGGGPYTLREVYDTTWTVSNITGGGAAAGGTITWTNITAASVTYRLSRVTDFSVAQATLKGSLTVGAISVAVGGDRVIPGGVPPFVSQVLLTPEMNIGGGLQGCTVTPLEIEGNWVNDGDTLTDAGIIPAEGLEFLPAFNDASLATGWTDLITPEAAALFWTDPNDVAGTSGRLVKVDSATDGFFNYNAVYGDQSTCMNVAYFYVVNNTGENPLFVYCGTGSDDSVGVRVNGRPVKSVVACRPNNYFGDKFVVGLDPGKNLFAVYVFENGGGFDMTFRFEDSAGTPIAIKTTIDPTGYNPDPAAHPIHVPPAPPKPPIYTQAGFITQFLVPLSPFEQGLTSNTKTNAVPEDYISFDGNPPDVNNVFEGAPAQPGTTLEITTDIRGASACGFTPLVLFDGTGGRGSTAGDPGLFDGEVFYRNQDQYSSTLFCFLDNKSASQTPAYIGFASDDAASLFVNGVLALEHLVGRGFGGANTIQTGPAEVLLEPGINLVQLSYTEGGGGSGARIGLWKNCTRSLTFAPNEVAPFAVPPGVGGGVTTVRALGQASCTGSASVTLTFTTQDGLERAVSVREELPVGAVGSNPSRGSFNAQGNVLTFNGQIQSGDTLTYNVAGVIAGASYCLGSVNNRPISGNNVFRTGTDVCDISNGYYVNSGGPARTDTSGRVWLEDTLANPSPHLTSPNAFTAVFGTALGLDLDFDPFIADREYPGLIFPDERWNNGPIEYTFTSLPPGEYEVTLLFMEGCCSDGCDSTLEDPALSAGACRVFDATVNGVFPTNDNSPAIGGEDGDQYSQWIAGGNANRIPTHLVARVPVTDGRIVVQITDLGDTNPPENASIKALAIEKVGDIVVGKLLHRGDADGNGQLQLTDAVRILGLLFLGSGEILCMDAADADDNGQLQLTDAVRILGVLFLGTGVIPPPGPTTEPCGIDPTEDELGCVSYVNC